MRNRYRNRFESRTRELEVALVEASFTFGCAWYFGEKCLVVHINFNLLGTIRRA